MKCIHFSLFFLLVNNVWTMDNTTNQNSTSESKSLIVEATEEARQLLKADNSEQRFKGFKIFWDWNRKDLAQMTIIKTEKNGDLIYHGTFEECDKRFEMLNIFGAGTFVYDDEEIPHLPGPRLILGRTTIPTIQEYDDMQAAPPPLFSSFPVEQIAGEFMSGIEEAFKRHNSGH